MVEVAVANPGLEDADVAVTLGGDGVFGDASLRVPAGGSAHYELLCVASHIPL